LTSSRAAGALLAALSAALSAGLAIAQAPAPDPVAAIMLEMFREHDGNTLCMLGDVPVSAARPQVIDQLKANGVGGSATRLEMEVATWTRFPCPFSPYRAELVPATAADLEGVWLFPHDSQPYRHGPKSPLQPTDRNRAIACEAVGYYPGGEMRTGTVVGNRACPFKEAADLDPARKKPRVASWSMGPNGRLKVARTDIKDYVEEWDVYTATRSFHALNLAIGAGDLVAYLRRDKDNDLNASTEFRHLQRLK